MSYRYLDFIAAMSSSFLLSFLWLCHDIGEAFWPWFLDSFSWCGAFVQHRLAFMCSACRYDRILNIVLTWKIRAARIDFFILRFLLCFLVVDRGGFVFSK